MITKLFFRFARNYVTLLEAVCELKTPGMVSYEEQNIHTRSAGELLLTIMRSLVQEESCSVIENITWGQRRSFEGVIAELNVLDEKRTRGPAAGQGVGITIRTLKKCLRILTKWNDTLWTVMAEKAIVHPYGSITFAFHNGSEITFKA